MSKRSRIILLSCVTVLCCVALVVAGTFALFTYRREVNNHLQAGTLTAKLVRTKLISTTLDPTTGMLKTGQPNTTEEDFTNENGKNVFGLGETETVAPGCSFAATLKLTNTGSVAFGFWIEITGINGDDALKSQLQLTVSVKDGSTKQAVLSSGDVAGIMGSESAPIGTLVVNGTAEFTVTLEFLSAAGNEAQAQTANFDLIVHAQQVTAQQ